MSDEDHIKILKQRYAKGEISKKEYLEMKEELDESENESENSDNTVKNEIKTERKSSAVGDFFGGLVKLVVVLVVLAVILVLGILYFLSNGTLGSLFSGAVTHSTAITNPVVSVSGYAKTNLGTSPISINFGSSTTSVSSNGYYSISLNNDQTYSISITYSGVTGNSNCNAGTLSLQTSSSSLFYNATC